MQIIPVIRQIAASYHATPAQIALTWVLAQGKDLIPIPGTKQVKYLEENIAAADIQLDEKDMQLFDTLQVYSEYYPKSGRRFVQA